MIKAILILSAVLMLVNPSYSHDLWDVRNGNDWLITNGRICVVTTYESAPTHANIAPTRLSVSIANYDWQALTPSQRIACDNLMKATITTILKAVPSKNGTRPTRDLATATIEQKLRVPDTVKCEGAIIKKYQKNRNWYKVVGLNVTTLCGAY